ncbi:hypothetical protein chiPu_0011053 [Chiloscyllium punctatum]|uniref:Uncharacterized protein n=1 Tax=Chiloscyllium punctatum TaxID=137246 RepID=A0A401SQC0_CHIPU|nr:hypothetical protein [Chiloscyllium punctatum]
MQGKGEKESENNNGNKKRDRSPPESDRAWWSLRREGQHLVGLDGRTTANRKMPAAVEDWDKTEENVSETFHRLQSNSHCKVILFVKYHGCLSKIQRLYTFY